MRVIFLSQVWGLVCDLGFRSLRSCHVFRGEAQARVRVIFPLYVVMCRYLQTCWETVCMNLNDSRLAAWEFERILTRMPKPQPLT